MLKKGMLYIACGIIPIVFSSCIGLFSSPQRVSLFDLGYPAELPALPYNLQIKAFRSDAPARYKMLFRRGSMLFQDERSQWVLMPADMLTLNCREAFRLSLPQSVLVNGNKENKEYALSGNLLIFETDLSAKVCRLCVQCSVFAVAEHESKAFFTKMYFVETPVTVSVGHEGADVAKAMHQAVDRFLHELYDDLSKKILSAETPVSQQKKK